MNERLADLWETAKVKWLMMDAQQKQAVILLSLSVGYTLIDLGGAVLKARISATTSGAETKGA